MGRAIECLLASAEDFELEYRADPALDTAMIPPRQGPDLCAVGAGEVAGIIDFSSSGGVIEAAGAAARLRVALVSGTTGIDDAARVALRAAAEVTPVCWSPNFSLGIPLLTAIVRDLARRLPAEWQIEIAETHHAAKRDAPSGTALRLADAWSSGRGGRLVHGREGAAGPRTSDEIGIHAIRLGEVVGEHRVLLGGAGEVLECLHRVQDRTAFATGALEALRRLMRRGPGWYEWEDLLARD